MVRQLAEEIQRGLAFVQRSAVRPAVWRAFLTAPGEQVSVLLVPYRGVSAGQLCCEVNEAIGDCGHLPWCVYNQSVVTGRFDFEAMVTRVLPLSDWWQSKVQPQLPRLLSIADASPSSRRARSLLVDLESPRASEGQSGFSSELLWGVRMLGVTSCALAGHAEWPGAPELLQAAARVLRGAADQGSRAESAPLFAVALNRNPVPCLQDSVRTIKGDAARSVFEIDCGGLVWAVIDSGIDLRHPAFAPASGERERVSRSYDFTRLGEILQLATSPDEEDRTRLEDFGLTANDARRFAKAVQRGEDVDWDLVTGALKVAKDDDAYFDSLDPHGTHVGGILGGRGGDAPGEAPGGVCPDIRLIDLRVLRDKTGDEDTEFQIISALQFIRHLNRNADKPVVHGVNLSLSLPHSVADYACGRTPICEECDRLTASGVVVVAAAGNYGFDRTDVAGTATTGGYRDLSITDPGNADSVITVGATHGKYPHRYGVSYFSSRGPTGDGRAKPDLVAPGENILCPTRGGAYEVASGTSMSAPHVSGAAALLMARHPELIGDPERVKQVLCDCATDLKRSADGQGRGLIDVLRAIQSI
ncbi:MAG: S8 family serine peptidase [Planctomycetales bacterium]|nr:S8 family serine peptidase [Planctomycetales bacterium]